MPCRCGTLTATTWPSPHGRHPTVARSTSSSPPGVSASSETTVVLVGRAVTTTRPTWLST